MWAAAHNETETTAEETLTMTVVEWGTGAETIVEARSGDELGLTLAEALAPKKVGPTFLGELELDGSESFAANGVADGARLVVETTLDVTGVVAKLNGGYRATDGETLWAMTIQI